MWSEGNRLPRYKSDKLHYPSDLAGDEWVLVEPLIPPGKRGGGRQTLSCAR